LNIKYTPLLLNEKKEEYLNKFGDLVEGFFRNGGMQVQFNVQDYKTLIDAKKNPEKYPEMIVRVSGYSAYFKDLSEPMKDELITRTQYNLFSGQAVPLPEDF
jgi:formate C-acetyltransferase